MHDVFTYTINGKTTGKMLYDSKEKALQYAIDEIKMQYLEDVTVSEPIGIYDARFPITNTGMKFRVIVNIPIYESYNALDLPFDQTEYIIGIHALTVI